MKKFSLIILILLSLSAFAQPSKKVDSLKTVASKNNAQAYFELFRMYRERDSASFFLQKALTYAEDKKLEADIRRAYATHYLSKGFYSMAQKQAFESLKLALELEDSLLISSAYQSLGSTAYYSHLYDRSLQFYEEALRYAPVSNRSVQVRLKNNYGLVLMEKNELYKATGLYQELIHGAKDSIELSTLHNNLGSVFLRIRNYDSAYHHILATLNISLGMHSNTRIMFNHKLMGQYYYGTKQFKKAKHHFLTALKLNENYSEVYSLWNFLELPELFQCMTEIYRQEKNTDSLLWLQANQINFQKELLEKHRKNSGEVVFDTQEGELNKLKQKQDQARRNQLEYYGIAFVILLALVAYFIFSGRDKKQKYAPYVSGIILILIFEFMLVVFNPLINQIAGDDSLYNFLCNVVLAFLIVPIQFMGEKALKKFAVEIRLRKIATE